GDFDGDGRDEIAIAPEGWDDNDEHLAAAWGMDFQPGTRTWRQLRPPTQQDTYSFRCIDAVYRRRFLAAGDFDRDGRDEIAVFPDLGGTEGNDFWVMDWDPSSLSWEHLREAGSPASTDADASAADYAAQFAVTGDFDGDGRDEIALAPAVDDSRGN